MFVYPFMHQFLVHLASLILFIVICGLLGFMHQPDEPKSLSSWEKVGNPLILHNTPTHMQPEQGANVEIKKGVEDLKYAESDRVL